MLYPRTSVANSDPESVACRLLAVAGIGFRGNQWFCGFKALASITNSDPESVAWRLMAVAGVGFRGKPMVLWF